MNVPADPPPPHDSDPAPPAAPSIDPRLMELLAAPLAKSPADAKPTIDVYVPNLPPARPVRRSWRGPMLLFLATCVSTFFVGATKWYPGPYLTNWETAQQMLLANWQNGLIYMGALLAILLTHEMGHFLTTVRYHIPATYPLFIPVPIHPIGTLGAVIGIDGLKANRREIFDLGLSGPIAGLCVAIPIFWIGIKRLDLTEPPGDLAFHNPLLGEWMMAQLHPQWAGRTIGFTQLNPYFMAGWVGMLITGLNMLPISQLDGGHVIHALFTDQSKFVARTFLVGAIAYVVIYGVYSWTIMLVLVILLGADHPPSANDQMPLGRLRWAIGLASLAIPLLCFAPLGIEA